MFGRKSKICPEFEITPKVPITGTHKQAYEDIKKKLHYFRTHLHNFRNKRYEVMNRDREFHGYTSGQLVYLYFPGNSLLNTGSKKIRCEFVGPLVIWKCFSPTQFILMSIDGIIYPYLIEETRLKPGIIRTTKGNVCTLDALKQIIRSGDLLTDLKL